MAIVRAPRPESHFYHLDKKISEDRRLSWAARGMLIYLLGKPDNWTVSVANLINETADCGKPLGRDGVRALLAELMEAGYLTRSLARGEEGKLGGYDYHVHEHGAAPQPPQPPQPEPVKPGPEKPETAQPGPATPPQTSTDMKQGLNETKERESRAKRSVVSSVDRPDDISPELWESFVALRTKKKAPITAVVLKEARKQAALAELTLERFVEIWCYRGSQGLEAAWLTREERKPAGQARRPSSHTGFDTIDYKDGIHADGSF